MGGTFRGLCSETIDVNRIFYPLALLALTAMGAILVLGLYLHSKDIRNPRDADAQRLATVHRLSGIAAGVCVLLVNSVVITYFVGTSRWTKEVSETYRLPNDFIARSNRLKRRAFPISVASMLVVVGVAALGGAADPGSSFSRDLIARFGDDFAWADVHLGAALAGMALIAVGFYYQASYIHDNQSVIQEVMAEVKRIRQERGLD